MRVLIGLGFAILLASCASTTSNYYTKTVRSWQGGNIQALIERWGTPDNSVAQANGDTIYYFRTENPQGETTQYSPGVGVNYSGSKPVIVTTPPTNTAWNRGNGTLSCTAIFVANTKGMIVDTKTDGSNCYGGESFADSNGNPNVPIKK